MRSTEQDKDRLPEIQGVPFILTRRMLICPRMYVHIYIRICFIYLFTCKYIVQGVAEPLRLPGSSLR